MLNLHRGSSSCRKTQVCAGSDRGAELASCQNVNTYGRKKKLQPCFILLSLRSNEKNLSYGQQTDQRF